MKKSFVLLVLLGGCASGIPQQQHAYALARYGPACGVTDEILNAPATDTRVQYAAACIKAKWQQDHATGLGIGMQNAGGILSPDVYNAQRGIPPRPAPPPTYNTYCFRDTSGNTNCTSTPQ